METKLEISIVDEARNSKQITWSFTINSQHVFSQLIKLIKKAWEQVFFVELPINF